MTVEHFDLEKLRISPELAAALEKQTAAVPPKASRRRKQFIRIPVTSWHDPLMKASHVTHKVAAEILRRYWTSYGEPFSLGNSGLGNVSRMQKRRALAELEALGLISVERYARRAPRVTVIRDNL
jgi:hypothetical protein